MLPSAYASARSPGHTAALVCLGLFSLSAFIIYAVPFLWSLNAWLSHHLLWNLTDTDFANYWMAGRMALDGDQHQLFVHEVYFSRLQQEFGADYQIHSWSYPPHFLLFLWPLGLLQYLPAMVVFLGVTFVLFVFSVIVFRRSLAPHASVPILCLALFGYVLMMLNANQNGFLTSALLLLGLACMNERPVVSGLCFACLTIKPQLGLLVPLLLLFDRNWRVFGWSALFAVVLVVASIIFWGVDSWHLYLTETLAYQRSVMTDWYGIFLRMMPTMFGSVRTLGFPADSAMAIQLPFSALAFVLVLWMLWKERNPLRRAVVVLVGTFLITPYAFNYDMGALSVATALLLGSDRIAANRSVAVMMAVLASLSAVVTNLGRAGWPIAPLILAAGLMIIAADTWKGIKPKLKPTAATSAG